MDETCPKCKATFRNIGHPLRAGVVMQRLCECPVTAVTAAKLLPAMRAAWKMEQAKSKSLSEIPFVAAQQIYSAFSKFGPPHSESCPEDCVVHSWGRSKFIEPRYDETFFEGVKSLNDDTECADDIVTMHILKQENLRLHTRIAEAADIIESYRLWALNEDAADVVEGLDTFLASNPPTTTPPPHKAWRIGRGGDVSSESAIYEGDKLIGTMDHARDAMIAVLAVNSWKTDQEVRPTFEWAKEQSELAYARGRAEGATALEIKKKDIASLLDIIGVALEALSHHDYDDPEHVITMHTKDLPDAYREACKALGAAVRILCVEDVGGGTLADRGLVRLEAVVKYLREREASIRKQPRHPPHTSWDTGALTELEEIIREFETGVLGAKLC
jgi:hypothetical protein